jgi:hypothetical protein
VVGVSYVFLWSGTRAHCRSFQRRSQNRCSGRHYGRYHHRLNSISSISHLRPLMFCQEKQIKILRKNSDPKVPFPLKLHARH